MIGVPRLASTPEWKQFLRLGEKLLDQPTASAQAALIEETVRQLLGAQATVWLAQPYYPLPGEPETAVLPSDDAPDDVQRVLETRKASTKGGNGGEDATRLAIYPLLTQDHLLGVLRVERTAGTPFRPEELNFLEGLASHAALTLQISRQVAIKNWRSDQLALVREVSSQIANVLDLDMLSRHVTDLIQRKFDYYYVGIFTLEERSDQLQFRALASLTNNPEHLREVKVGLGEGIVGRAAASGEEILSTDVQSDSRYRFVDGLPETRSEVALPLKVGERVLGVLDVQSDEPAAFHENDMLVLRSLADTIALAFEDARLYSNLRRRADQVSALFEITRTLTSILDLNELLDAVVEALQKRFGYPYVHLFTVHPGRRKIFYAAGSGARSHSFEQHEVHYDLDAEQGIIPWVARNNQSLLVNRVEDEPLYVPNKLPPLETRAEMAIPLAMAGEVLGVLDLQSDHADAFDPNDLSLFEALAGSIAIAMRNASLYRSEAWRRQVAESFRDVAGLVSANTALDELLNSILKEVERNLPCDAVALWLTDPSDTAEMPVLRLAAVRGVDPALVEGELYASGQARAWVTHAILSRQPTIRQPSDPYGPLGRALNFPPDYSSIAVPLYAGEDYLGLLTLAHHTDHRYGSEAAALITTFAGYAAVAIQNTRLFHTAQEQAFVSTVLLQVAEAGQTVSAVDDLFETMARLTPLLVGIHKCAFFVWDEWQQGFVLKSYAGFELPDDQDPVFRDEDAPAFQRLRQEGGTVVVYDAARELNLPEAASSQRGTLVLLPLMVRGQLLGAFLVTHEVTAPLTDRPFDEQNLAILQGIAHQTAITLENLRLLEARQEEAYVTAVLLQAAQAVVSQTELKDILETIIGLMSILVGLDTAAIYLWDASSQTFRLAQSSRPDATDETRFLPAIPSGKLPVLDAVMKTDRTVLAPLPNMNIPPVDWDLYNPVDASEVQEHPEWLGKTWLAGIPLSVKGEAFGALVVLEKDSPPSIRERRLEMINGIAQQISLAVQNERLNQEMVERERLEREMQLARQIQKTFLPDRLPQPRQWQLDVQWQTARQVGGDFYDVFWLGKNRLGLVVADVADKGLAAALYMTVTRTLIRAVTQNLGSPGRVLERVNNLLVVESPNGLFVTAVFAVLRTDTGELTYANAGHNRPLILRGGSKKVEQLPLGGMAMGIQQNNNLPDHLFELNPGDALVLFTDGVTECFSPAGETFGDERLSATLSSVPEPRSARALLQWIEQDLRLFRLGELPSDDLTLVVALREPGSE